jgi:hypothetical protein
LRALPIEQDQTLSPLSKHHTANVQRRSAMIRSLLIVLAAIGWIWAHAPPARAHCDGADGPVATAAQRAIETGNVNLALPYAPQSAEQEIIAKFQEARRVRTRGRDARALADRAFVETVVRLHRAGEGAGFTGLRPAGTDYGPVVPAAEQALSIGDLAGVKHILMEEIAHGLAERLTRVQALRSASTEPRDHDGVAAARERISAELAFITYGETVRQAIREAAHARHED